MTSEDDLHRQPVGYGFVILPRQLSQATLASARREIGELLAGTEWGSGFDGSRTRRVWALLSRTRCMDEATLDPVVLEMVHRTIGPGSQFSLTQATQIHPGQTAQVLHYEQGIYPLPRDREVMITAMWAFDDFTAANGATLLVPRSHELGEGKPHLTDTIPAEMPAGSVLIFLGRLWHAGGANVWITRALASSSTTCSPGCGPAKLIRSARILIRSGHCPSGSRSCSALTRPRPSASSPASTRWPGCGAIY